MTILRAVAAAAVAVLAIAVWFALRSVGTGGRDQQAPATPGPTSPIASSARLDASAVDARGAAVEPARVPVVMPAPAGVIRIDGSLAMADGQPLGGVPFRVAVEDAARTSFVRGVTSADGRFAAGWDGGAHALMLEFEFADGSIRRELRRAPELAGEPWALGTLVADEVAALHLELAVGRDARDGLAAGGATIEMRVRADGGGGRSLLAVDLAAAELPDTVAHTLCTVGATPLWIGVGVRGEFSPVTSWFHRVVRSPPPGVWTERASIADRMVIVGRVVDEHGVPVHGVAVEFAVVSGEARLLRAVTDGAGRFVLVPAGPERGALCVKIGAERGPAIDVGPGDRPELRVDLSRRVALRFLHAGVPVAEAFFAGAAHPSRREDAASSGLARFRRPHREGVVRLGTDALAAGSRIYFESAALGERLVTLPFDVGADTAPTAVELGDALGSVAVALTLPAGARGVLALEEVVAAGVAVPERMRARYRIDVDAGDATLPSILRLRYRATLTLGDGRVAVGELDMDARHAWRVVEDGGRLRWEPAA